MNLLFYYPNRPTLVPADSVSPMNPTPTYLNSLETSGRWVAEQKFNGDNCLIYTNKGTPTLWNRTHEILSYKPTSEMLKELKVFPNDSIINAELMHRHTKTIKDLLIVHCVMAWKGELLLGRTWGDSRHLLEGLGLRETQRGPGEMPSFVHGVYLSATWKTGFWNLFQEADGKIIEGIVLKDPKGILKFSTSPIGGVPWMLKVRKPCAKYNF